MNSGLIATILLLVSGVATYQGLKDPEYLERHSLRVGRVLGYREYGRLLSSGFLHVSWLHWGMNMVTLLAFSYALEMVLGLRQFAILYAASLLGGSLLALFMHRHDSGYGAVGASGAVSGLVFASIGLFPGIEVGIPFVEGASVPGWLFGLLYTVYTIYGIKSRRDNIGHDAHLGGGLVGLATALIMMPWALRVNYLPILAIAGPAAGFMYVLIRRPHLLHTETGFFAAPDTGLLTLDDRDNGARRQREAELNRLLEKISNRGLDSLSPREKQRLQQLSKWWQDVEA